MGIGEICTVRNVPQPHILSRRCSQMKVRLGVAAPGPAGEPGHVIRAYLAPTAPAIFHHSYGALLWVVCKE